MNRTRLIAATSITLAALGITSLMMAVMPRPGESQPGEDRAPAPIAQPGPRPDATMEIRIDPDSLRQRLNRSIMRSQQVLERSQAALVKLDAGASATEVLAEMRLDGFSRPQDNDERGTQRPPPPRGEEGPKTGRRGTLSPEEREQLQAFLVEYFPDLWANLSPFIENDPRSADGLLLSMAPPIREILFLRKTQPELSAIKIEQMRIGLDFVEASRVYRMKRNAPDSTQPEIDSALDALRDLAAARFDADLRAKQFEIDRLESRLGELRASLEEIRNRRDKEIEHMVASEKHNARRQQLRQHQADQSGDD